MSKCRVWSKDSKVALRLSSNFMIDVNWKPFAELAH